MPPLNSACAALVGSLHPRHPRRLKGHIGRFAFAPQHVQPGDFVELRCDMDLIVAISTAPHPLDPNTTYAPGKVGIVAWHSGPAAQDDFCRTFRPENARAHHNTDLLDL